MKIYTKTGDAGTTSLVGGTRVSKAHPRVMTYGDLDELISWLGVIRCEVESESEHDTLLAEAGQIRRIQEFLMQVSAHFAADHEVSKLKPLDEKEILYLEESIDAMTAALPEQKAFILPAAPQISSFCHVARTVCRRAERSAVQIEDKSEQDVIGTKYINRLSDYLFTLARYLCMVRCEKDDFWLP